MLLVDMGNTPNRRIFTYLSQMEMMVISLIFWPVPNNASVRGLIFDLRVFTSAVSLGPVGRAVHEIVTPSEAGLMIDVTVVVLITIDPKEQGPSMVQASSHKPDFNCGK